MRRFLITCALIAGLPLVALANLPIFKIADFNTPAPDGGTFTSFGLPTAIERQSPLYGFPYSSFAFQASTSTGLSGVYYYTFDNSTGALNESGTIADTAMAVPQGGATFASFTNVSSGYGEAGFIATDSNGVQGVYTQSDRGLNLIATTSTLDPTGVPFGQFHSISICSDSVAGDLGGAIESDSGIYVFNGLGGTDGQLQFTKVPNTAIFHDLSYKSVAFTGPVSYKAPQIGDLYYGDMHGFLTMRGTTGGVEGIYVDNAVQFPDTGTGNLVSIGSTVPGNDGSPTNATFTSFGDPIETSNELVFSARYQTPGGSGGQGIFTNGPYKNQFEDYPFLFREIVATGEEAPDSGGAIFTAFSALTDDSYNRIFIAELSNGQTGLYYNVTGYSSGANLLYKVLETGDTIDGKSVTSISLSPEGAEGGDAELPKYAFELGFTDGSHGLYYFNLPEPGLLELLVLPLLLALGSRRRKRSHSARRTHAIEPLEPRRLLSLPPATTIGLNIADSAAPFFYTVPNTQPPVVRSEYLVAGNSSDATANTQTLNDAILDVRENQNTDGNTGRIIYIPNGTYYFDGSAQIITGVTIRGESANGTILAFTGGSAFQLTPSANGIRTPDNDPTPGLNITMAGISLQNLTIQSDGVGIEINAAMTPKHSGVDTLDVENVKFETVGTAIDLPAPASGFEGAQQAFIHNVDISVGDSITGINFVADSEAVNISGNANVIDGLLIEGKTTSDYSGPTHGLVDIEAYGTYPAGDCLLKNLTISADFSAQSSPITDVYVMNMDNVAVQNAYIAQATTTPNTEFEIVSSDVTFDSLTLDKNDTLSVDSDYAHTFGQQPSIVVADQLQIDTADGAQIPNDCIQNNSDGEVHISTLLPNVSTWPAASWPAGGGAVDNPAPIATKGVDVTSADAAYPVKPNSDKSIDAAQNTASLRYLISAIETDPDANYTLYFPAGIYYIDDSLLIPSTSTAVQLIGDGSGSTIIHDVGTTVEANEFNQNPDHPDLGLVELQEQDGQPVHATIANLSLENTLPNGAGISADDGPITVNDLDVEHVGFATGLYANNAVVAWGGPGIDLPAADAESTNCKFIDLTAKSSLVGSLINISGNSNTIEACNDSDDHVPASGATFVVNSNSESISTATSILGCVTERGGGVVYYNLSGGNINFYANYIFDNAFLGCVLLNNVSGFEADSLPAGVGDGDGIGSTITGSELHVRIIDGIGNDGMTHKEDGTPFGTQTWLYNPDNPDDLDHSDLNALNSLVKIDVVRYFEMRIVLSNDKYSWAYPVKAGLDDPTLTSPALQIDTVNGGNGLSFPNTDRKQIGVAPYPYNFDVPIVGNSATMSITNSASDPGHVTVEGSAVINDPINNDLVLNVVSYDWPYIISPTSGTTLTVDWSASMPAKGVSVSFDATGTGNKIVVNEPTDNQQFVTFVQGVPGSGLVGAPQDLIDRTFGVSNVQEIDTGSGSYNTVLDLSDGTPSDGIYYKGTGSTNTIEIVGSAECNSFVVTSGVPSSGQIGISGVSLITTTMGQSYTLSLMNLGDLTSLAADSQDNSTLDLLGDGGSPIYSVDMSNIGQIDFQLNAKEEAENDNNINIGALPVTPTGYTYGFNSGGDLSAALNLYGQGTQASPFIIGHSSITMDTNNLVTLDFAMFDGQIILHDSGLRGGGIEYDYSEGTPLNVKYIGNGNSLDVYGVGANSYTFIPTNYSNVSSVMFHGNDGNDTLSLPFYAGRGGAFGMPSYGITFNGGDGNDTVSINADSVNNTFEISGSNIIVDGDTSDPIVTIGVENVIINGGSEADTVTVDANTALNVNFNGGTGDSLKLIESADSLTIAGENEVTYGNAGTAVSFAGVPSVTLEGDGDANYVNAGGGGTDEFDINGDNTLSAFGRNFAFDNVELNLTDATVVYNAPNSGETLHAYLDGGTNKFTDGTITVDLGASTGNYSSLVVNLLGGSNTFWAGLGSYAESSPDTLITINVPAGSSNSVYLDAVANVDTIVIHAINVGTGASYNYNQSKALSFN